MRKTEMIPVARYSGAAYPRVPMTLVETWLLSPTGPSLANPKSESLALYFCKAPCNKAAQ